MPIDHSRNMFGIEIMANEITAMLYDRIIFTVTVFVGALLVVMLVVGYIEKHNDVMKIC